MLTVLCDTKVTTDNCPEGAPFRFQTVIWSAEPRIYRYSDIAAAIKGHIRAVDEVRDENRPPDDE